MNMPDAESGTWRSVKWLIDFYSVVTVKTVCGEEWAVADFLEIKRIEPRMNEHEHI